MKQAFAKNDATDAARTIWRAEVQDAITTQIRVPFDVLCTPKYDFTRNIVELDIVTTVTLTDDEKADVATNYAASPELIPLATEARLSAKREAIAHRVANTARDLTARMPKAIAYVKAAHMFAVVARDFADELGTLAEFANDPRGAADALREVLSIGCVADAFGGVYQQARIAAK